MSSFSTIRQNVSNTLTGGSLNSTQLNDSNIQTKIQSIVNSCTSNLRLFQAPTGGSTFIFSDLTVNANKEPCSSISNSYSRLVNIAIAVMTPGSPTIGHPAYNVYYNDATLRGNVISALDWLYTNWSSPSLWILTGGSKNYPFVQDAAGNKNWFVYEVGIPLNVGNIMCLLYSYLTSTQLANWCDMVWFYNTVDNNATPKVVSPMNCMYSNTWTDTLSTGANLAWKAQVFIVNGACCDSSTYVQSGVDAMASMFTFGVSDDGFWQDGSFVQHINFPYAYGYGRYQLDSQTFLMNIVNSTTYDITDKNKDNIYQFIYKCYEQGSWNVRIPQRATGREISRNGSNDKYILGTLCNIGGYLVPIAPDEHKIRIERMIKQWGQANTSVNILSSSNIYQYTKIEPWYNDANITPRGDLISFKPMNKQLLPFVQRSKWAAGLSMSSTTIKSYESINSENVTGYNQGSGWLQIHTGDYDHYNKQYHPCVDPFRLPGTTTLNGVKIAQNTANVSNFAGGVEQGQNGIVGYQFQPKYDLDRPVIGVNNTYTTLSLSANKAYFYGDEFVVCMGNGLSSTDNVPVETIIENRRLLNGSTPTNALSINNSTQSTSLGLNLSTSTNWFHMQGNTSGSMDQHIGVYFPTATTVKYKREQRVGKWRDMNQATYYSLINNTKTFDSYTSEIAPTTNYSSASDMYVKNATGDSMHTYMNFDMTTVEYFDNSFQAKLHFLARNTTNVSSVINIYSVTPGWTAGGINWSNAPSTISLIGSITVIDNVDRIYNIDLSAHVLSLYTNAQTQVSLRISTSGTATTRIQPVTGDNNESPKVVICGSPETINLSCTDTYVDEANNTVNYSTNVNNYACSDVGVKKESLLTFDISNLDANADVYGALLRVYANNNSSNTVTLNVDAIDPSTYTINSVTWNTRPTTIIQNLGTITVNGTTQQYYKLDIASYVRARKLANFSSIGIRITMQTTTTDQVLFYANDNLVLTPQLSVNLEYKRNFLTTYIDHGINCGTSTSYAYAMYPNTNASDMNTLNTNGPDWSIIQNTTSASCIAYNTKNMTSTVFWTDTSTSVTNNGVTITSDSKSIVSMRDCNDHVEITCMDATQSKIGVINVNVTGIDLPGILYLDNNVTVSRISGGVSLAINVTNSNGTAFNASFSKGCIVNCVADTYVDSGAATTNFGSANNMVVKNGVRLSYLRFDLTGYSSITSAKVRLFSQQTTSNNGVNVNVGVHEFTDNTWSENSVTWNTRPNDTNIVTTPLGTYTINVKNRYIPVVVDITSLCQARLADTKIVNICLKESTAGNYIMVHSRNNSTNNQSPVLLVDGGIIDQRIVSNGTSLVKTYFSDLNTSRVTLEFNITPSVTGSTHKVGVTGYSTSLTNIDTAAAVLQLTSSNTFQALNSASYASVNTVTYAANVTYAVKVVIDHATSTYDLYVNNTMIASTYAFGSPSTNAGQIAVTSSSGLITLDTVKFSMVNDTFEQNAIVQMSGPPRDTTITSVVNLRTIDDSFVEQANPSNNFGTNVNLLVKYYSGSSRQTYLKFDVANYSGATSAILKLYSQKTTATNATVHIYAAANTTWSESSLTWTNAPGVTGGSLGSYTLTNLNTYQWYNIDITTYVKAQIAAGATKISLCLQESTNVNSYIMINSDENASNQPLLTVTFPIATTSYTPTDDTYVQQANPTVNYGTSSSNLMKYYPSSERHMYMMFNCSDITNSGYISSATLKLRAQNTGNSGPVTVGVWQTASSTWAESTVTWNTAPGSTGTTLGSMTITGQSNYNNLTLDLTSFLKTIVTPSNKLVPLYFKETTTSTTSYIMVDSKETTSGTKPLLDVIMSIPNNFNTSSWSVSSESLPTRKVLSQTFAYNVQCLGVTGSNSFSSDASIKICIMPKSTGMCGVFFKQQDENNTYALYLDSVTQYMKVVKLIGGVETVLALHPIVYTVNAIYNAIISCSGTNYDVQFSQGNACPIQFYFSDSQYSSGYISCFTNKASAVFDDITVKSMVGVSKNVLDPITIQKVVRNAEINFTLQPLQNNTYGLISFFEASSLISLRNLPVALILSPSGVFAYKDSNGATVLSSLNYSTSTSYSVQFTLDIAYMKWSCSVTPFGGSATTICTNIAFDSLALLSTCVNRCVCYSDRQIGVYKITNLTCTQL